MKLQKKVIRNVASAKYNSHTDPLFRKLKILKFTDLYEFSMVIFMFQIALKMHPPTINRIFTTSSNFDRNLDFQIKFSGTTGLLNQLHSTLVINWNRQAAGIKGWLKEYPEDIVKNKSIFSLPSKVTSNDYKLNNFRINGCKKALMDKLILNYNSVVHCHNKYCSDCK